MNWLKGTLVVGAVICTGLPASAQVCTPLQVVGGTGTKISKKVSNPSTPVSPSNWNTDFTVPSGQRFSRYVATLVAKNKGEYTVQVNLKYNNSSADKVFDQKVTLRDGQARSIAGSPRLNADPYQVNISVGGVRVLGNAYTVSAAGCR